MEAVPTVQMEVTKLLRLVPKTALRATSDVAMANASRAVGNAMD